MGLILGIASPLILIIALAAIITCVCLRRRSTSRSVSGLQKQGSEFDGKIVLHASEGNGKDDKSLIFAAQI